MKVHFSPATKLVHFEDNDDGKIVILTSNGTYKPVDWAEVRKDTKERRRRDILKKYGKEFRKINPEK